MKTFFKLTYIVLAATALQVISSCSDFLEKPLQGELTQQSFPTSGDDALLATNAVYNVLRNSNYNQGLFPILDIMSDDGRKGSNPDDAASTIGPYDNFTHYATEGSLSRWWSTLYEGIKRANVVIEYVPLITGMDASLQTRYIAEAKFLRAVYYFDLVRAWGDVPIRTTAAPESGLTRDSSDEVYDLIEQDLLDALGVLPEKSEYPASDLGRATKGAARGMLARVYLFRQDFVNAEKYALEVINSGQYDLEADFADANSVNGEHGVESVFEIGAVGEENLAAGGNQYANVQGVRGSPNRGWGFNRPSLDLQNSFETDDPRLDKTVIFLGEELDGITILGDNATPDETRDAGNNLIEIEVYNQKVWTPGTTPPESFGYNRRLIRYADVLLMAAEALNENNKAADALVYLNEVRERARGGNPVLPDIAETNQALLRDIIFDERRHELALEGHRFWDLIRTGRAAAVLGPLGFDTGKDELLPVPQSEIDLSLGDIDQNPGWD